MLVGHLAAGMLAKRIEPKVSLGAFLLAAMLPDFLWCAFLLAGIECVQYQPGLGAARYIQSFEVSYSQSLMMDAVWAVLFAFAYFLWRRRSRGAVVVAATVLSHWLLDFVGFRAPLLPGARRYFGLGLWNSVPTTLFVEGGLWVLALAIYTTRTRSIKWAGLFLYWPVAAVITLIWYANIAGPPPPNPRSAPAASLIIFSLIVAWGFGLDCLREFQPKRQPA